MFNKIQKLVFCLPIEQDNKIKPYTIFYSFLDDIADDLTFLSIYFSINKQVNNDLFMSHILVSRARLIQSFFICYRYFCLSNTLRFTSSFFSCFFQSSPHIILRFSLDYLPSHVIGNAYLQIIFCSSIPCNYYLELPYFTYSVDKPSPSFLSLVSYSIFFVLPNSHFKY